MEKVEAYLALRIVRDNVDRGTDEYNDAIDLIRSNPDFADQVVSLPRHSHNLRTSIAGLVSGKKTL